MTFLNIGSGQGYLTFLKKTWKWKDVSAATINEPLKYLFKKFWEKEVFPDALKIA